MPTTASPFGMKPITQGQGWSQVPFYNLNGIASAYGSAIYQGSPVILATDGTLTIGTTAAAIIGAFIGCQYQPSGGRPTISNMWTASTTLATGTTCQAWYWQDPGIIYEMQSSATVAATAVGDQADFVNPGTGSTITGLSNCTINATLAGAGVQKQLRIVGLALDPNNAWGDTYVNLQVMIAQHQYVYPQTAI